MLNALNNLWLELYPPDIPIWMKTQHSVLIMMSGVVTSDGDVIPPYIFPRSLRLNAEAYTKCLEYVVPTWIERVVIGRPYVWQQDFASRHTSRRTQCWLWEKFCNHITPNNLRPNSQTTILLVIMSELNLSQIPRKLLVIDTKDNRTFTNFIKETSRKAFRRFRSRLEVVTFSLNEFNLSII